MAKQWQELVQGPVSLAPQCQRRLLRQLSGNRGIRHFELVRARGEALCPPDRARRVRGVGKAPSTKGCWTQDTE